MFARKITSSYVAVTPGIGAGDISAVLTNIYEYY